ncbi:hypothetical protein LOK49_LG07G01617 [Camellia lanceoleosa]|uniref:Uncharacterized protein n=1 Tax=Camellia lanceoleosa TaxID=1840588 RepID=A0ACC0H2K1_9ERIC|nr:hypothetical protein LOK49_LG07G01617 [Camellia lanceoleosa]
MLPTVLASIVVKLSIRKSLQLKWQGDKLYSLATPSFSSCFTYSAVQSAGRTVSDNSQLEFEAKSSRDGAWLVFWPLRFRTYGFRDVLVRFAGFGREEDEWVNVPGHIGQRWRSLYWLQEGDRQQRVFDLIRIDGGRRQRSLVGRYNSPDEHPFFPTNLPEPMLPPLLYPQVLHPCASSININNFDLEHVLSRPSSEVGKTRDDGNSGSTAFVTQFACGVGEAMAMRPLEGEQWLQPLQRGLVPPSNTNPCTYIPGGGRGYCTLAENEINFSGQIGHLPPAFPNVMVEFGTAQNANDSRKQEEKSS